jgi:hypothetical protein
MTFCDVALSRRLERAEGRACVQYAEARRRLFPESEAAGIVTLHVPLAGGDSVDAPFREVTLLPVRLHLYIQTR